MIIENNEFDITLDKEFQFLLPPLEESVYTQLEQSILQHGIRDPLVLWEGILIDGYNRYKISKEHDIPFNTVNMEFPTRDEVIIWIITNQNNRRNLTPMQHKFFRGLHYHAEKRIITNAGGKNQYNEVEAHNELQPKSESTAQRLARQYNVSHNTIKRDGQVANTILAIGEVSPNIKTDILLGKVHISNIQLLELAAGTEEDISALINQVEDGTFVNRKSGVSNSQVNDNDDNITGNPGKISHMHLWENQFIKMTDEFRNIIKTQLKPDDIAVAKIALRKYIGMLEELYNEM